MKTRQLRKKDWREIRRTMQALECEDWTILRLLMNAWRAEK
jgi:hypothetical protein